MDLAARRQPDPLVQVGHLRQTGVVGADQVITFAPDHQGGVAQAVALVEEVAQPFVARPIGDLKDREILVGHVGERGAAFIDHLRIAEDRADLGVPIEELDLALQAPGHEQVVGVQDRDVLAAGPPQAPVQGDAGAAVGRQHLEADARVGDRADRLDRAVGRPVVGDDDLEVLERLLEHAGEALAHVGRVPVAGDDHADARRGVRGRGAQCDGPPSPQSIASQMRWASSSVRPPKNGRQSTCVDRRVATGSWSGWAEGRCR